jgi:GNAT superfamily N-acetyltransferase
LPSSRNLSAKLSFKELSEKTWGDFETLFGARGACGGCWCMYWRLTRSEYEKNKGAGNKRMMKRLVQQKPSPGILMYVGTAVAGWCALAPREHFALLERSRVLKRVDEQTVWSVVCFFIAKEFRRRGLTVPFLQYVIEHSRTQNVRILEGYPVDVRANDYPPVFAHVGFYNAFRKAGFEEVARWSPTRPIMRKYL